MGYIIAWSVFLYTWFFCDVHENNMVRLCHQGLNFQMPRFILCPWANGIWRSLFFVFSTSGQVYARFTRAYLFADIIKIKSHLSRNEEKRAQSATVCLYWIIEHAQVFTSNVTGYVQAIAKSMVSCPSIHPRAHLHHWNICTQAIRLDLGLVERDSELFPLESFCKEKKAFDSFKSVGIIRSSESPFTLLKGKH